MEGPLGICRIGHRLINQEELARCSNAAAPCLPGVRKTRAFAFKRAALIHWQGAVEWVIDKRFHGGDSRCMPAFWQHPWTAQKPDRRVIAALSQPNLLEQKPRGSGRAADDGTWPLRVATLRPVGQFCARATHPAPLRGAGAAAVARTSVSATLALERGPDALWISGAGSWRFCGRPSGKRPGGARGPLVSVEQAGAFVSRRGLHGCAQRLRKP